MSETTEGTDAYRRDAERTHAFGVTVAGVGTDEGVYWAETRGRALARAWNHFRDVFDTRHYTFRDFIRDARVRRRPEFDGAFTGRQGILPEFAALTDAPSKED